MEKEVLQDISYIQKIMKRSELSFNLFCRLFIKLGVLWLVLCMILQIIGAIINRSMFPSGGWFYGVYLNSLLQIIFRCVLFIPLFAILLSTKKEIMNSNRGISIWLFHIIKYVLVFAEIIIPIVITVLASHEAAELFTLFGIGFCMLIFGVLTEYSRLKTTAYWYLGVATFVLTVAGFSLKLIDYYGILSASLATGLMSVLFMVYWWYPAIGCFWLAWTLHKLAKEGDDVNEY